MIVVLITATATMSGLYINQSLRLNEVVAELEKAKTSTDEYAMMVMPATIHNANITIVEWPSTNLTSLKTPVRIEVIMPQGFDAITEVEKVHGTTRYSVATTSGYPDKGITTITFVTDSDDNFDLVLGEQYRLPVSGTALVTMWTEDQKIQEPVQININRDTDFALHFKFTTVKATQDSRN